VRPQANSSSFVAGRCGTVAAPAFVKVITSAFPIFHGPVLSSGKPAMASTSPNPELFRRALGNFATGVTVITVEREPGQVHGMTANSFTSVSISPFLVLVCVDQDARLLSFLKAQRRFGVSVLHSSQQALSEHFAKGEQGPEADEQLGIHFRWTETGVPLLEGALAHLACNVVAEHLAGDHTVFLAEVESVDLKEGEPLLYYRGQYRSLGPLA
jgi:flavin reductase (DIM6/NTAB) family NADH-FMN oxidoreductase RutF